MTLKVVAKQAATFSSRSVMGRYLQRDRARSTALRTPGPTGDSTVTEVTLPRVSMQSLAVSCGGGAYSDGGKRIGGMLPLSR